MGRTPTLLDVAAHARVSTATVSRCLNMPDRVAEKTRLRVQAAIQELGYAPNFSAQALAAKRTNTFGAIIPTMENAIFAQGVQAFQEELERHGITLLVASSSYSPELEDTQIRTLAARGADALLLIGQDRDPAIDAFLAQRGIPVVTAWGYDPAGAHLTVGFDNRTAMKALALEVLRLGHRKLAIITPEETHNDRARSRMRGIQDALPEFGLHASALQIVQTPHSVEDGARAFAAVMARDQPTAVLCFNDVLAAGALRQAWHMGLSVPEDVSITGFGDIELAELVRPGLTTVHVPHRDMGRRAALALVALRNGEAAGPSIALPAQIKWRETLGPAPTGLGKTPKS